VFLSHRMEHPLRVLQIFNRYLEYGGEQASVSRIGDTLQEIAEVEYFLTSSAQLVGRDGLDEPVKAAVHALHNPEVVGRLRRYQRIGRFDIWQIHNVFPTMSPSVYSLAFELGIPVVQYLHNYRMSCVNGYFLNHGENCTSCIHGNFVKAGLTGCWRDSRFISGWMGLVMTRVRALGVFRRVSAWIALSESQKKLHVQMGIPLDRIHVNPHFFVPRKSMFIEEPGCDALFVGRLSKEKGVCQLLDAWKLLRNDEARLLIAGDGPERAALEQKVAKENISRVEFFGFVPVEEQEALWRRAAFSVVPSIWQDPLPTVVFEAWERGRSMIVSDAGGLADSVDDGIDGLKSPMRDAKAWAGAMDKLLADPSLCERMARAGAAKLTRKFTQKIWLKKMEEIYSSVMAEASSRSPWTIKPVDR